MSDAEIKIRANGPYVVRGSFVVLDANGEEIEAERKNDTIALCRCGASANKPFCDKSHASAGFADSGLATVPTA